MMKSLAWGDRTKDTVARVDLDSRLGKGEKKERKERGEGQTSEEELTSGQTISRAMKSLTWYSRLFFPPQEKI